MRFPAFVSAIVMGLAACGGAEPRHAAMPEPRLASEGAVVASDPARTADSAVDADAGTPGPAPRRTSSVRETPTPMHEAASARGGELRRCYEEGLQRRPDLVGTVLVFFTVSSRGRVQNVEIVRSDLADERVESCIVHVIERWRMPRPQGDREVRVRYPFTFSPST